MFRVVCLLCEECFHSSGPRQSTKWAWIHSLRQATWPLLRWWLCGSERRQCQSLVRLLSAAPGSFFQHANFGAHLATGQCLYILVSPWSSWQYVGRTASVEQRHYQHFSAMLQPLSRGLPAYGAIRRLRNLPCRHPFFAFFLLPFASCQASVDEAIAAEALLLRSNAWDLNCPRVWMHTPKRCQPPGVQLKIALDANEPRRLCRFRQQQGATIASAKPCRRSALYALMRDGLLRRGGTARAKHGLAVFHHCCAQLPLLRLWRELHAHASCRQHRLALRDLRCRAKRLHFQLPVAALRLSTPWPGLHLYLRSLRRSVRIMLGRLAAAELMQRSMRYARWFRLRICWSRTQSLGDALRNAHRWNASLHAADSWPRPCAQFQGWPMVMLPDGQRHVAGTLTTVPWPVSLRWLASTSSGWRMPPAGNMHKTLLQDLVKCFSRLLLTPGRKPRTRRSTCAPSCAMHLLPLSRCPRPRRHLTSTLH